MSYVKLKSGRQSKHITDEMRAELLRIKDRECMTIDQMSEKVGISYLRLYGAISGRYCSPDSYKKIERYIAREQKKERREAEKREPEQEGQEERSTIEHDRKRGIVKMHGKVNFVIGKRE